MLLITLKRIEKQLIRWGYPSYLVENMKPWSLLSCYDNEKKKRERLFTASDFSSKPKVYDREVKSIKSEKKSKKYQGVRVPYKHLDR